MKNSKVMLSKINKQFPHVTKVVDADESIHVSVQKRDSTKGNRSDPSSCALAKACLREEKADGALINLGFSYIIKGNVATRYKTSVAVGREITSFDRHQDFAPGNDYLLSRVPPSARLDRHRTPLSLKGGPHTSKSTNRPSQLHRTVRVRQVRNPKS
jgi:hypothetical protein